MSKILSRLDELLESLDTKVEIVWTKTKGHHEGVFMMSGTNYIISLLPDKFDGFDILSVSFKVENGTMHATRFMKDQYKILGAVYSGVLDKVASMKFDGLWFSAKKNFSLGGDHETRTSLYKRIVQRLEKRNGWHFTSFDVKGDSVFVTSPEYKFIEHIRKLRASPKEF